MKGCGFLTSKQMQYAIMLSQTRSFSQVAKSCNISQPALSKHIQSLESELGVKLFDRNCVPLKLAPAGEYFIREAGNLLSQETQLLHSMEQFRTGDKGQLHIGVSPFRNLFLMPAVVTRLREQYPNVQVVIHEASSDLLRKDAAEGKYDFAILNLPVDQSLFDIYPLEPEQLVLAVPNRFCGSLPHSDRDGIPQVDFADCGSLPFVVVGQGQEMRQVYDSLCAKHAVMPEIAVEVFGGVTTAWSMANAGIGATLLPLSFAKEQNLGGSLTLFTLRGHEFRRQPVIAVKSGQYLSEFAQFAISLLTG